MRLAGQAKGGYYPAHPDAVAAILERLRPPTAAECCILDPCAGQGAALQQLADGLGAKAFGIELSEDRAEVLRSRLPEGQALAPADFLRTAISVRSFSLVYCNPPYDYATGQQGRVEEEFVQRALSLVADNGVLCLVCPEAVADRWQVAEFFAENCRDTSAFAFPKECRRYNETVLLGYRRRQAQPAADASYDWLERQVRKSVVYALPAAAGPAMFRKSEPTDAELARMVAVSPLRHLLQPVAERKQRPRPPMSLGEGHQAMLLASGFVDGLICPPGENPHVVRGIARKQSYVKSCDTHEDEEGNETTKTVLSEKPVICVRVLDSEGTITTLED
jgi:hypothetical protein